MFDIHYLCIKLYFCVIFVYFQGLLLYFDQVASQPIIIDVEWFKDALVQSERLSEAEELFNDTRCPALPRNIPFFTKKDLFERWKLSKGSTVNTSTIHNFFYKPQCYILRKSYNFLCKLFDFSVISRCVMTSCVRSVCL